MAKKTLATPLGLLRLTEDGGFLTGLSWSDDVVGRDADAENIEITAKEITAYFNGQLKEFSQPYKLKGTPFQQKVWRAMAEIPYGKTVTYGELAVKLNTSARAIGGACGKNPLPIIVPCHRVLAAGHKLGGYSGGDGLKTKQKLLALEKRCN